MEGMESLKAISERALNLSPSSQKAEPYSCEPCSDTGWLYVFGEDGERRGVVKCTCLIERIVSRIPPRYRQVTLASITPDVKRHAKQDEVIGKLRTNPNASYLFFGRNGCGKSLFGWLLYRSAVEDSRPTVGVSLSELLAEFRAWEMEKVEPRITVADMRDRKGRWLIFLDEIEKARPSEFAAEKLFRVLDEAYNFDHQIVITSNLRPKELQDHWSRASDQWGPAIMRRLFESRDAVNVEMY